MLTSNENVHLHNRFDLELIDSRTGKIKQTAKAENVVLNTFWTYANGQGRFVRLLTGIAMGTGSGTPAVTDSSLFNQAFYTDNVTKVSRTIAKPTSTLVGQVTFPATSAYVGNLTEIGIRADLPRDATGTSTEYATRLLTHAMLTDSEGNPITINKTDLDVLIVTATLYMTISTTAGFYPWYSDYNNFIKILDTYSNSYYKGPLYTHINTTSTDYPLLTFYSCATPTRVGGAYQVSTASQAYSTKLKSVTGNRLMTTDGNTNFFNGIGLSNHGYFTLPNTNVFPLYTMAGISVGTGNGTQTDFDCPIPMFVKDTDVIYKNGVALTRGTDYTIDNLQNKLALACISAFNFADTPLPSVYDARSTSFANASKVLFSTQGMSLYGYSLANEVIATAHLENADPTIGRNVNRMKAVFAAYQVNGSNNASALPLTGNLIFEYSTDGATWHTITSYAVSGRNSGTVEAMFSTVAPAHARVRFVGTYTTSSGYTPLICFTESYLSYAGNPIHFSTAPASGDVITMECQIDRPFKNENHVIDASIAIQF